MPASKKPDEETAKLAIRMAEVGVSFEQIAKVLGMCADTLKKYLGDELNKAKTLANMEVAQTLYQKAIKGNVPCMIFWLKCQARWSETIKHDHTGTIEIPQPVYHSPSDEQLPKAPAYLADIEREIDSEVH